jgi:hypothetical protein
MSQNQTHQVNSVYQPFNRKTQQLNSLAIMDLIFHRNQKARKKTSKIHIPVHKHVSVVHSCGEIFFTSEMISQPAKSLKQRREIPKSAMKSSTVILSSNA